MAVEIVRRVAADDLRYILARPRTIELAEKFPLDRFVDFVTACPTRGGVLLEDGAPVVASGVTPITQKVAFVWLTASVDLRKHLLTVVRELRAGIADALAEGLELRTSITAGQDSAKRFVEYLGFKQVPGRNSTYFLRK